MAERVLTLRELNRATLARQHLLERTFLTPLNVLERLVGLQAQQVNAPYIGLWTRLHAFKRSDLIFLLESRRVVKATLMRSTLHLMTTEDYVHFRLALQPAMSHALAPFLTARGIDSDQFTTLLRTYIQEQPRTGAELRTQFGHLFPGLNPGHISDALRAQIPLVTIFPNGIWGFTGRPAYTEASAWLERPLSPPETGLHPLILRYLAAFGPASVKDIQTWSGLTRLQETIEALRPELRTFRDEQGKELFDLPDAPLPSEHTPAPPRFLPEYDNLLLSHANRTRILTDAYRRSVFVGNGVRATFLVDGFAHGVWKIERTPASTILVIEPFEPLSDQIRNALEEEGAQLLRWLLDGTEICEIQFRSYQ